MLLTLGLGFKSFFGAISNAFAGEFIKGKVISILAMLLAAGRKIKVRGAISPTTAVVDIGLFTNLFLYFIISYKVSNLLKKKKFKQNFYRQTK